MATGSDRRAVVTGGAGAIGSSLVRTLLERGAEVTVIDNLGSGQLANLGDAQSHPRFRFVKADLREPERIQLAFRGATEAWHLAANADIRKGTESPKIDLEQGTIATFNVLEACRTSNVPRVYFSSSSTVYGLPTQFPTPEEYGPLLPESQYGAAKLAAEGLVSAFAYSYGLTAGIYRFANIIGPGMNHGAIWDFVKKLQATPDRLEVLGDGRQAKSYLWTQDCVDGMLHAAQRATGPVHILNLGSQDQITVAEIAQKVVAAMGNTAKIALAGGERGWVGDIPKQFLATDRIRALGWKPRYNSAEAVDRSIAVVRSALGA
jgi:UDP-glucose 4-epimerase